VRRRRPPESRRTPRADADGDQVEVGRTDLPAGQHGRQRLKEALFADARRLPRFLVQEDLVAEQRETGGACGLLDGQEDHARQKVNRTLRRLLSRPLR